MSATVELRPAETVAGLAAWRAVRVAVLPNERTATVEQLHDAREDDTLYLLALLDGEVVGSGVASRSDTGGAFIQPRVLPASRGRGVGAHLLRALADHAYACGHESGYSMVEEPGAAAFASRFGFTERNRQIEQVYAVSGDEPEPEVPAGISIVALAGREDLRSRLWGELVADSLADLVLDRPVAITEEVYFQSWLPSTDWAFVALRDDELVGMAGLVDDADRPDRAENALTAVRRDSRRTGIGRALKQRTLRCAADRGLAEVYTWTQTGNEAMQELNRSLGYVDRDVVVSVGRDLPLL
jgi:GNAT superfamily N-acetyltransferase